MKMALSTIKPGLKLIFGILQTFLLLPLLQFFTAFFFVHIFSFSHAYVHYYYYHINTHYFSQ